MARSVDFDAWWQREGANIPIVLYRYMSAEGAIATLLSKKLRLSSPLTFNDPFDSQWDSLWQTRTNEFARVHAARLSRLLTDDSDLSTIENLEWRTLVEENRTRLRGLSEAARRSAIIDLAYRDSHDIDADYQEKLHSLLQKTRVLCMSETHDCPLMWGHYACKHEGVAIELDIVGLCKQFDRPVQRVQYPQGGNFPKVIDEQDWLDAMVYARSPNTDYTKVVDAITLTKDPRWSYEREWRFFWKDDDNPTSNYTDFPIPKKSILRIILGHRIPPAQGETILNIITDSWPSVEVLQARPSADRFALELDTIHSWSAGSEYVPCGTEIPGFRLSK